MSIANLSALRPIYDGWARGNFTVGLDLLAEDVVFVAPSVDGEYRGPGAVVTWFAEMLASWENLRYVADGFVPTRDLVLVVGRQTATGRSSGIPVEMEVCHLWAFDAGSVGYVRVLDDRGEALRAFGSMLADAEP